MAKLVDALDLKFKAARRVGSTPTPGTTMRNVPHLRTPSDRCASVAGRLIATALWLAFALMADPVRAAESANTDPADRAFKLTVGTYRFSSGGAGVDTNLRHSSDLGNIWLGQFDSPKLELHQTRAGWDRSFGEAVRLTPSLQAASGGFAGTSLQLEAGEQWFLGGGLGRTNLKPYWNLNFDPNDSFNLAAGYRGGDGQSLTVQYIRDNRLNPDQRHMHLVWRQSVAGRGRITADLLYKRGMVEDALIRRWGASLTYDWPGVFLRVARDPKANFGSDDLWRFSAGIRF